MPPLLCGRRLTASKLPALHRLRRREMDGICIYAQSQAARLLRFHVFQLLVGCTRSKTDRSGTQAGGSAWSIARQTEVLKPLFSPYSRGLPPGSPGVLITPYLRSAFVRHSSTAFKISSQLASRVTACNTKTSTYHCPSLYFGFAISFVHLAVFWTVLPIPAWALTAGPSRKERVRSLYASLTRRFTRLRATALLSTFFAATKPTKGILVVCD